MECYSQNKYQVRTLAMFVFLLMSCNPFSLDDVKLKNTITEKKVVRDKESAQKLLNKAYALHKSDNINRVIYGISAFGASLDLSGYAPDGIINNKISPANALYINNIYKLFYSVINHSNFLIDNLVAGKAKDMTKKQTNEMLSEARTLRGLAHFYLLRIFGEFYDLNSKYGVVVHTKPFVDVSEAKARSSVKDTYDAIESDFKYAAQNGPKGKESFYVNALASKAFLAQVYLYQKKYTLAAQTAKEIIDDGTYKLEPVYADIFSGAITGSGFGRTNGNDKGRWKSKETLFCIFAPDDDSRLKEGFVTNPYGQYMDPSDHMLKVADKQVGNATDGSGGSTTPKYNSGYDPRFSYSYKYYLWGALSKFPFTGSLHGNTIYFMRLAEVYYIYAEAEAMRNRW